MDYEIFLITLLGLETFNFEPGFTILHKNGNNVGYIKTVAIENKDGNNIGYETLINDGEVEFYTTRPADNKNNVFRYNLKILIGLSPTNVTISRNPRIDSFYLTVGKSIYFEVDKKTLKFAFDYLDDGLDINDRVEIESNNDDFRYTHKIWAGIQSNTFKFRNSILTIINNMGTATITVHSKVNNRYRLKEENHNKSVVGITLSEVLRKETVGHDSLAKLIQLLDNRLPFAILSNPAIKIPNNFQPFLDKVTQKKVR